MAVLSYIFICVKIKRYSGNDRQISALTSTTGIPFLIWEPLQLLLYTSMYLRLQISTTPDLKL